MRYHSIGAVHLGFFTVVVWLLVFCFETGSHYVDQDHIVFTAIYLPL